MVAIFVVWMAGIKEFDQSFDQDRESARLHANDDKNSGVNGSSNPPTIRHADREGLSFQTTEMT